VICKNIYRNVCKNVDQTYKKLIGHKPAIMRF